jgi:hypothetical protein
LKLADDENVDVAKEEKAPNFIYANFMQKIECIVADPGAIERQWRITRF